MSAFSRILSLVGVVLLLAQLSLGQTTVAVSPASKTVNMPNQFTIDIVVNNVANCRAANIQVAFDHNILTYNSAAKGPFLPDALAPGALVTVGAQYDVITFDQSVLGVNSYTGSGTLVTITFTAKAVGTTAMDMQSAVLRSPPNNPITCSIVDGSVTVDPALPIQLSSFTALRLVGSGVLLQWKTLSEIDNLGFEIERSLVAAGPFETIPGSFIAGHGTTVEPQDYSYTDLNSEGKPWFYRLKQMDRSGPVHYSEAVQANVTADVEELAVPKAYALEQNFPNPFNPTTTINYQLPAAGQVKLVVYDALGREVATLVKGTRDAGYHKELFNASGLSSGLYFYQLKAGEQTFFKKMLLVK